MAGAKVFISYCHEDKEYVARLRRHFGLLESQYAVEIWDDSRIRAGEDWNNKIESALVSSDLYVCLLSADFFASDFIRTNEIPAMLSALGTGKSILPIYVGPLGVDDHQFSRMQGLNNPERPLQSMDAAQQESFYAEATKAIREALKSIADTPPLEATAQLMETAIASTGGEEMAAKGRKTRLSVASDEGSAPYNIAIIGRTGVGKSELFNYLFGTPLQAVGVGKPVTERGFHKQAFELKGVRGNLFDSWGLEVGNHTEWQKALDKELKERGTDKPPEEWFHTILFCIDASGARIQPFEAQIIQTFRKQKFNVIVVLTKSDVTSTRKRQELRDAICGEIGQITCVEVGSQEEELPVGKTETFGADDLIEQMFLSFWDSIAQRLPRRCCLRVEKEIDRWLGKAEKYIEKNSGWFNKKNVAIHVQEDFERLSKDTFRPDGIFDHTFRKELASLSRVYLNAEGVFRSSISKRSVPRLGKADKQPFSDRMTTAFDNSASFWNNFLDQSSVGYTASFVSMMGLVFFTNPVTAIAAGIGIGALAALGVKTGSIVTKLAGKEAFKENLMESLEDATDKLKKVVRKSEPDLERAIREKIPTEVKAIEQQA